MDYIYPKHLYDPIRREIAVSFIRRELKIFLPSIKEDYQWKEIHKDVESWFSDAPYLYPVRDFWNGLDGIMMGFKLIDHLLSFITAENITWTKELVRISELIILPEATGPVLNQEDPIIVTQKRIENVDRLVVYDGNNRANKAKAEGSETILAYVSRFNDESRTPVNYWLPTSLLMEINHFAKKSFEQNNMDIYRAYVTIFTDMLRDSESAKYEMKHRVILKETEYKRRILSDLKLL